MKCVAYDNGLLKHGPAGRTQWMVLILPSSLWGEDVLAVIVISAIARAIVLLAIMTQRRHLVPEPWTMKGGRTT